MADRNAKLLYVDRESAARTVVVGFFERYGLSVWSAVGAEEAKALFAQHRPTIMISELDLGEIDGLSLMAALAARFPFPRTRFCLLTVRSRIVESILPGSPFQPEVIWKPKSLGQVTEVLASQFRTVIRR